MKTLKTNDTPSVIDLQKQVGAAIRRERQAAGLSLRDLEEATGIGRGHLSNFENGKTNLTLETLHKLAGAIGCAVPDYFSIKKAAY